MDKPSQISSLFREFYDSEDVPEIMSSFSALCSEIQLDQAQYYDFYPKLKSSVDTWRANPLWELLDDRISQPIYSSQPCKGTRVLVVGAGPVGLRVAIEGALLGAMVDVIDKRNSFNRNNVLHLWPFLIHDLKSLGIKHFFSKFCSGSIDHINIKRLQRILLKICLILGIKFHPSVTFHDLIEPQNDSEGWRVLVEPASSQVSSYNFNAIICSDGKQYSVPGFTGKEFRAKLAIGITMNFVNRKTRQEAQVKEGGLAFQYSQAYFKSLIEKHGIELENIVYFKDETHYFVMTAKKASLLAKGVLLADFETSTELLRPENVNHEAMEEYAKEAAGFITDGGLGELEFALNHRQQHDVAIFDFTGLMSSSNASRIVERHGQRLLLCIVGDSLFESFWPTGSGLAKGFLGGFDAAWMLKRYSEGVPPLEIIEERESLFSGLRGVSSRMTLQTNICQYTIDPSTRYPNVGFKIAPSYDITSLYDIDD